MMPSLDLSANGVSMPNTATTTPTWAPSFLPYSKAPLSLVLASSGIYAGPSPVLSSGCAVPVSAFSPSQTSVIMVSAGIAALAPRTEPTYSSALLFLIATEPPVDS